MAHEKKDAKEHYKWPLRPIVTIERDGKSHKGILSCGHFYIYRTSSAYKPGTNTPFTKRSKRCQDCYVEAQERIAAELKAVRNSQK